VHRALAAPLDAGHLPSRLKSNRRMMSARYADASPRDVDAIGVTRGSSIDRLIRPPRHATFQNARFGVPKPQRPRSQSRPATGTDQDCNP